MHRLRLEDTWNILEYEKRRTQFRADIIALKKKRRVAVGDNINLVFENRDTVLFQVQEMIRIERLVEESRIRHELEVYNPLIPDEGALSATLFIEYGERSQLQPALLELVGLDQHVALKIGDKVTIPAQFEAGRTRLDGISAVQYLQFAFSPRQQRAFVDGREPVTVVIDHPHYQSETLLPMQTRYELAKDLSTRS